MGARSQLGKVAKAEGPATVQNGLDERAVPRFGTIRLIR